MIFFQKITKAVLTAAVSHSLLFSIVNAVPPHPNLLAELKASNKELPYYLQHIDELKAKGVCQPERFIDKKWIEDKSELWQSTAIPFRILAVLVKFTDHPSSVAPSYFDSLVFSTNGSSVRRYFSEISYSQIDLVTVNLPSSLGWRTAPQSYSYYVNKQSGLGAYPNNCQKMVEDLVDQIDPLVDFTKYDNDGNGYVDVLLVIHSGVGAEFSGSNNDIWSHKWSISSRLKDGVYISSYTAQPEFWVAPGDMTIGIYAHELCHGFGLPDLYDIDQSSNGIGKWCIMSVGAWNGPYPGGSSPAHPCAWSRIEMGFATPTNVISNLNSLAINDVNANGTIYRLWTCGEVGPEYFLLENRQKIGYDSYLPQSGLLIWHVDEAKVSNTQEWYPGLVNTNHYKVALEQGDGLYELEHDIDNGDGADPFPGSGNKTSFDALSSPNSDSYTAGATGVAIQNIRATGNTVYANLTVKAYGCCCGERGDANGDGVDANMTDLGIVVNYVFRGSGDPGPCHAESDVNGDGAGPDLFDLTYLVNRIFRGGPAPLSCL